MLQDEMEEQLHSLKREVDELRAEVAEMKRNSTDEVHLLPGVEYDFVPTPPPENIIATFKGRIVLIEEATHELGLSDAEWASLLEECGTDE